MRKIGLRAYWRGVGVGFVCHFCGEFGAADGVEIGSRVGMAQETPFGIGEGLDEVLFLWDMASLRLNTINLQRSILRPASHFRRFFVAHFEESKRPAGPANN